MSSDNTFFDHICAQGTLLLLLFIFGWLGLVLTVISLLVVDPDSGAYVISFVNLAGILLLIGGTGITIWRCQRKMAYQR